MGLAVVIVVGAAALALALGGRFAALGTLHFRGSRLVVFAVLGQLLGAGLAWTTNERGFYPVGLAVSALAALAFCARNLELPGVPLIALGLLANALVVGINGAMPVSGTAAERAGVSTAGIAAGDDARHTIADRHTRLRLLGDVIPVPLPLRPAVASPGDLLVAAGLGQLVLVGMRPRRRSGRRKTPAGEPGRATPRGTPPSRSPAGPRPA